MQDAGPPSGLPAGVAGFGIFPSPSLGAAPLASKTNIRASTVGTGSVITRPAGGCRRRRRRRHDRHQDTGAQQHGGGDRPPNSPAALVTVHGEKRTRGKIRSMHDPPEAPEGFLSAVRDAVGPAHCLTDPDLKAGYEVDWTRRFGGPALLVARPADTAEVAKVLVACARYHVPVVPQGGNTGLVGGSVPRGGEAVISLGRLGRVLHCDADDGLLVAEAGTTLGVAQAAAGRVGSELGIDIAARDSATLGGMVATNAGGVHVVRYGPMRSRLAGIEVVLADGTVASRLSGLVKDNVGYDLAQLMAGSEGTLGVVTKVVLRLVPVPEYRVAALIALRGGPGGGDPGPAAIQGRRRSVAAAALTS